MSSALYNREILRLAASLIPDDRIENPDGIAEARSPLCGSRINAEVAIDTKAVIKKVAIRASSCALGQASAAILRQNVTGQNIHSVGDIRSGILAALTGEGAMPTLWADLQLLAVAREYKARHAAILLPYDAVLAALENIKAKAV
jgi:NifU-like protein involved in Fe-S cluster formation